MLELYENITVFLKGGGVSIIEQLLVVQEHDSRILQLEKEARDIPLRKDLELERLKGHKVSVEAAEEALKGKLSSLKQLEVETASKQAKIAKLRVQQMDLKTNKEFKAMENEIELIERSIGTTEDKELSVMAEIESARSSVAESRKELEAEEAEVREDIESLDSRLGGLEAEMSDEAAARKSAATDIDSTWLVRYDAIFKSKAGGALVPTAGGICGGCHMTLPPYLQHDAKKRLGMVVCGFCGRLLY